jgi:hypothetical protein
MSKPSETLPADFLTDRTTKFRLRMSFLVGWYEDQFYAEQEGQREIVVLFLLRFPEDETQPPWLDYQIEECGNTFALIRPYFRAPGVDEFCPRSRRLPAEGLREVFAWLDEVNLWEWQPLDSLDRSANGAPAAARASRYPLAEAFYDLDPTLCLNMTSESQVFWHLEVSRGGRSFSQGLAVQGAPAPTAYAFEEGAWSFPTCPQVPILPNHLLFLTNDPIIIGLAKRLLRLLPEKKPRKQVAEFDDGRGSRYELDFDRMVARKVAKNFGLGLGPWGFLPAKTEEVPMTEYDRMGFWSILFDFKTTPQGFQPAGLFDTITDREPNPGEKGRRWFGKICDGKTKWTFPLRRTTDIDDTLFSRFCSAFESPFAQRTANNISGPLPHVDLPVSRYVRGGITPWPLPVEPSLPDYLPLYEGPPEERLRLRVAEAEARPASSGVLAAAAFMGHVPSMLRLGWIWHDEAARLGSHEAMVAVANHLYGISPDKPSSKLELEGNRVRRCEEVVAAGLASDANGLGRKYYETAYKAGYRPAALGLGFLHEHGIGVPRDEAKAVAYYKEYLGDLGDLIDESQVFACSGLRCLYRDSAASRNDSEHDWLAALLEVYWDKKAAQQARWEHDQAGDEMARKDKEYADALSRWDKLKEKRRKEASG